VIIAERNGDNGIGHNGISTDECVSLTPQPIFVCLRYLTVVLLPRCCAICRQSLDRQLRDPELRGICTRCLPSMTEALFASVSSVDQTVVVWVYDDSTGPLVSAAKSVGGTALMKRLAFPLARRVGPYIQGSTTVTWVPPSGRGQRRRGFDQGRVLAGSVGKVLHIPTAPAFVRSGKAQFGGSRSIRLHGPRLSLRPDWKRRPPTTQVILVDDVITTGASMAAAARKLRQHSPYLDVVGAALAVRM
jgi:predicted amidophosphoribosyltransferase